MNPAEKDEVRTRKSPKVKSHGRARKKKRKRDLPAKILTTTKNDLSVKIVKNSRNDLTNQNGAALPVETHPAKGRDPEVETVSDDLENRVAVIDLRAKIDQGEGIVLEAEI